MNTKCKAFIYGTEWLALLAIVCLSGCLGPSFHYPGFKGIAQHLESLDKTQKATVDVVLFHGMGIHEEAWAEPTKPRPDTAKAWLDPEIIQTLLPGWKKSVKSEKQCFAIKKNSQEEAEFECRDPKNRKATDDKEKPDIKIETISFTLKRKDRHQEIRFHAVIWSGLTTPFKQKLCSDISEEDARESLGCEKNEKNYYVQGEFTSQLKSSIINTNLSDVVIYLGGNKEGIQKAFRFSIAKILDNGNDNTNASLVIITSSLASHILVESLSETKKTAVAAEKAEDVAEKTAAAAKEAKAAAEKAEDVAEETGSAANEAKAAANEAKAAAEKAKAGAEKVDDVAEKVDAVASKAAVVDEKAKAGAEKADDVAEKVDAVASKAAVVDEKAKAGAEKVDDVAERAGAVAGKANALAMAIAVGVEKTDDVAKGTDVVAKATAVGAEKAKAVAERSDALAKTARVAAEGADTLAKESQKAAKKDDDAAEGTDVLAKATAVGAEKAKAVAERSDALAKTASVAAGEADAVAGEADAVSGEANAAAKEAQKAAQKADDVAEGTDAVATEAAAAAEKAKTAADGANEIAQETGAVAGEANAVAKEAQKAAQKVDDVATEAAVAAEKAKTAADGAEEIAQAADAVATKAAVAAKKAKTAADGAEEIAQAADAVATEAVVAAEKAKIKAEKAKVAAKAADPRAKRDDKKSMLGKLNDRFEFMVEKEIPISIFMAANQIPLLKLAQEVDFGVFQRLIKKEEGTDLKIEVVAFTDPNDVLSYTIEELKNATVTNVIINNIWDFGLIEGLLFGEGVPLVMAHTGYLENETVWKLILCGRSEICSAFQ